MSERTKTGLCVGLLLLMTVLFFGSAIFSTKTFIARDNYIFYNPRHFYAANMLQAGEIPLWNPYNACGTPFQANMQNALFYPPTLLYYVLPFQTGFKYYIIFHYFLAALSMFALMRGWGKTRGAGLVAAMVFAFGGYMLSLNEAVAFLASGSWLPLIMLFHHYALKTGRPLYALLCGTFLGIQILAGDFSFYFGASLVCTLVYTAYWVLHKKTSGTAVKYCGFLLLAWLIAVLLAAVQIFPFVEYIYHSTRFGGLSYDQATKWSFSFIEILQLFIPKVLGTLVPNTKWAGQIWLDTIYAGIFSVIFAGVCVFFVRDALKAFLLPLLFLSIFFASGEYNPLYRFFFDAIPFVRMVQFPVKFIFIAAFSLAALAGIGAQKFSSSLSSRKNKTIFFTGLLLMCLMPALLLALSKFKEGLLLELFSLIYSDKAVLKPFMKAQFYIIGQGLTVLFGFSTLFLIAAYVVLIKKQYRRYFVPCAVLVIFIDLLFIGKHEKPLVEEALIMDKPGTVAFLEKDESLFRVYPLTRFAVKQNFLHHFYVSFDPAYRMLKEGQLANLNVYHGLQSADEYTEAPNRNFVEIFGRVEQYFLENLPSRKNIDSWNSIKKVLDFLNIKYIISPYTLPEDGLRLVRDGDIKIYKNPDALPRAYLYDAIYVFDTDSDLVSFLVSDVFEPRQMLTVPRKEFAIARQWLESNTPERGSPHVLNVELKEYGRNQKQWVAKPHNPGAADQQILKGTIDFIEYSPNRLRLDVDVNKCAFLFISDSYYPGWKASLNGDELPIMRVNQAFRAIPVAAGRHTLELVFKPPMFTLGMYISIITFLGLIAALSSMCLRHTRTQG